MTTECGGRPRPSTTGTPARELTPTGPTTIIIQWQIQAWQSSTRNWDFHWSETGASGDSCSQTYYGPEPFSEVKTSQSSILDISSIRWKLATSETGLGLARTGSSSTKLSTATASSSWYHGEMWLKLYSKCLTTNLCPQGLHWDSSSWLRRDVWSRSQRLRCSSCGPRGILRGSKRSLSLSNFKITRLAASHACSTLQQEPPLTGPSVWLTSHTCTGGGQLSRPTLWYGIYTMD